jgi:hypothetical protein
MSDSPARNGSSKRCARARPEQLAALSVCPPMVVAARLVPRSCSDVTAIVEQRTARARCSLLLDPVGSIPFTRGKPRRWLMTAPLDAWPTEQFALELELCPLRGSATPTLVSYAVPGAPPFVLREQASGGLTVEVGGHAIASAVHLDYAQWQRIAVAWDAHTRRLRLYKDDGGARVEAEGSGRPPAPLGAPLFEAVLPPGAAVAAGGTLVVGQLQGRPGVPADFAPEHEFHGALAEVRVWREVPDFRLPTVREPDENPALLARWRFSALALTLGEALAMPGSPSALLGGFGPSELRDVSHLRAIGSDDRQAWASGPAIAVNGEREIELSLAAGLALRLDGIALARTPLDPADVPGGERRGFRIGALDDLCELRLHGADGKPIAHYSCDGTLSNLLNDLSGKGLDLAVEP